MANDRPLPDAVAALAERLADAVVGVLPSDVGADIRSRVDEVVESMMTRLDLVPREEYQRQLEALDRLERRLADLEARLGALERDPGGRG